VGLRVKETDKGFDTHLNSDTYLNLDEDYKWRLITCLHCPWN
jgi:hypothetical protein